MLCRRCVGRVDKNVHPGYCGNCGYGLITDPAGNPTNITCLEAPNYTAVVNLGLLGKDVPPFVSTESQASPTTLHSAPETAASSTSPGTGSTDAVLSAIIASGLIGKSEIMKISGVSEADYRPAIVFLLAGGLIVQEGERRGAKYRVKK